MERRINLVVAIAMALVGIVIIWAASGIRLGMMRDPIGPRAAFYLCGGVLVVGGLWVVWRSLLRHAKSLGGHEEGDGVADEPGFPASATRAFTLMAGAAVFGLLLKPAGFLIATPLFMAFALLLLGKRGLKVIALVPTAFTGLTYLIFAEVLGVRLPLGPLTDVFRSLGWVTL